MTTPVNKVNGIGPKTTEFLKSQGITTAEALIKSGVEKLALAPGFNQSRATTAIDAANTLINEPQSKVPSIITAKPSSKARTAKSDKKDKKGKKNKDKKSKNKKGKKDKKKDKKKNKK